MEGSDFPDKKGGVVLKKGVSLFVILNNLSNVILQCFAHLHCLSFFDVLPNKVLHLFSLIITH